MLLHSESIFRILWQRIDPWFMESEPTVRDDLPHGGLDPPVPSDEHYFHDPLPEEW